MWDVIEKLEELDRSDERKELKQGEIVNLLLYTEEPNSSVSEDESKQINFKEVNEVYQKSHYYQLLEIVHKKYVIRL